MPDGAMYMMVGLDRKAFPEFANCLKIVEGMVREQSVFCLPGKCFGINDFFRVVLTGKQSYRFMIYLHDCCLTIISKLVSLAYQIQFFIQFPKKIWKQHAIELNSFAKIIYQL